MELYKNPICYLLYTLLCTVLFFISGSEVKSENRQTSKEKTEAAAFIVDTEYGKVEGVAAGNHLEFRGIPFAKPPLGNLRFKEILIFVHSGSKLAYYFLKPPERVENWKDKEPLLASTFPEYCIQFNVFWNKTEGQEDCLYLSVFTPIVSQPLQDVSNPLPVMVFIHPGGFMFGRGSQFRADYLMETRKVIAVTFHYRLGSFGFLNTGDNASSGNMGMKDQIMVLQWVRDNIRNFGGNPEKVLIFGTSAGAASVHYHLLSPMSAGLFHRAISNSGTALCPWAFQPHPIKNSRKLAALLNCPQDNSEHLVNCLREKDAQEIAIAHSNFIQWYTDPISAFGPSKELVADESNFLVEDPFTIIKWGTVNFVPWIVGFTSDEGYDHSYGIIRDPKLLKELNEDWANIFPSTFEFHLTSDSLKEKIATEIKKLYFNFEPVSQEHLMNLSNAYSDTAFVHCAIQSALAHAKIGKQHPVYLYKFNYKGQHSILNLRGYPNAGFGSNHMDDLQFVMNSILYPTLQDKSQDKEFSKKYLRMLTDFANDGVLTPLISDESLRSGSEWPPLQPTDGIYWYLLNSDSRMEKCSKEFEQRMKFWDAIHTHRYTNDDLLDVKENQKEEL